MKPTVIATLIAMLFVGAALLLSSMKGVWW